MKETIERRLELLLNEINCRREHGADGEEHLLYIEIELKEIINDYRGMLDQFRSIWRKHVTKDNKNA